MYSLNNDDKYVENKKEREERRGRGEREEKSAFNDTKDMRHVINPEDR